VGCRPASVAGPRHQRGHACPPHILSFIEAVVFHIPPSLCVLIAVAAMADENKNKALSSSSIPPPLDPFPTYQTPYPRSNKEVENPFIQFRRFADEQLSSFFNGIPHLFGFSLPTDSWKSEFEDMTRRRHELEEGWRKQFEQEMEEMRQTFHNQRPEERNGGDEEQTKPWWASGGTAQGPASSGDRPRPGARKCPAWYEESKGPKTELDAYDDVWTLNGTKRQDGLSQQSRDKPATGGWLSALGWDGQQRSKLGDFSVDTDGPAPPKENGISRARKYTMFHTRRMDPFENPDHTIPWLLLSPYSPIYLCNPSQPRLFKVRLQDGEDLPLQISRPRFFERWTTDVDERLARQLPWADAFEDLVSLHQTGKMIERDSSTWRTPNTWIHDMVGRGSLGSRWGFNDDGILVKRWDGRDPSVSQSTSRSGCRWYRGWKGAPVAAQQPPQAEEPKLPEVPEAGNDDMFDEIDKAVESLVQMPLFGSILSAADGILSAVEQSQQAIDDEVAKPLEDDTQLDQASTDGTALESPANEQRQYWSSSSSSTSSSWYDSTDDDPRSVVSTLTTTERRTLPDGSVETRRVLKKRFADGTEESNESVEVQNAPSQNAPSPPNRKEFTAPVKTDKPTPTPVQDELKKEKERKGGWFWT